MAEKSKKRGGMELLLNRLHFSVEKTTRKLEFARRRLVRIEEDLTRARKELDDLTFNRAGVNHLLETYSPTSRKKKDRNSQGVVMPPPDMDGKPKKLQDRQRIIVARAAEAAQKVKERRNLVTENHVAEVLQKLDVLSHNNEEIRKKIEEVRRTRLQCNSVCKTLVNNIRNVNNSIGSLTGEYKLQHELFARAQTEMRELKRESDKERKEFDKQIKIMQQDMLMREKEKKEVEVKMFKRTLQNHQIEMAAGKEGKNEGKEGFIQTTRDGGAARDGGAGPKDKDKKRDEKEKDKDKDKDGKEGLDGKDVGKDAGGVGGKDTTKDGKDATKDGKDGAASGGSGIGKDSSGRTEKDIEQESSLAHELAAQVKSSSIGKADSGSPGAGSADGTVAVPGKGGVRIKTFDEMLMMRRILRGSFCNCIQRKHIKQHTKNMEMYTSVFDMIRDSTGISDIDEIVRIFQKLEERNYSLLVYINLINREIQQLLKRNWSINNEYVLTKEEEEEFARQSKELAQDFSIQYDKVAGYLAENNREMQEEEDLLAKLLPMVESVAKNLAGQNKTLLRTTGVSAQELEEAGQYYRKGKLLPTQKLAGGQSKDNSLALLTHIKASSEEDATLYDYLHFIERCLTQWCEFLPILTLVEKGAAETPFPYTVGQSVKHNLVPKKGIADNKQSSLVKQGDLPAANLVEEARKKKEKKEDDEEEEEEPDLPLSRTELRNKVLHVLARRAKKKKEAKGATPSKEDKTLEVLFAKGKPDRKEGKVGGGGDDELAEGGSSDSSGSSEDSAGAPTDDRINEIFMEKYKMSKDDLQKMADNLGIALNNLCYLKQEFDLYDEDQSGFIDLFELRDLLEKLGEALSDEELVQAFHELDQDSSGEIEFSEFVEWFTGDE